MLGTQRVKRKRAALSARKWWMECGESRNRSEEIELIERSSDNCDIIGREGTAGRSPCSREGAVEVRLL